MFCTLFQDRTNLLELYNAVNQTEYTDENMLDYVTLENAVYMSMQNDLAFVIDLHMNLYEHQSTYNPNMPLRDLFYVAGEYKRLYANESIYSSRKLNILAPRFIVFYNGTKECNDVEEMKLSDLYVCREDDPQLELKVKAYNINSGRNIELMKKCQVLSEYSTFVSYVRELIKEHNTDLNTAVSRAVEYCINKGILRDFLTKYRAEVLDMCIYEWNEEEKEKYRRTEYKYGMKDGIKIGEKQGLIKGEHKGADNKLLSLIQRKINKGKNLEQIADELDEDINEITRVYNQNK